MTISHHSHSGEFCLHAKGTLEEVVQEAIRKGFTTFGLSEHIPRYRAVDLYPEEVSTSIRTRPPAAGEAGAHDGAIEHHRSILESSISPRPSKRIW